MRKLTITAQNIRIVVIVAMLCSIIGLLALWASRQSYVRIEIDSSEATDSARVRIYNKTYEQDSLLPMTNSTKVRVPQGDYTVYASAKNSASFEIVKTKGFFQTTTVKLSLLPELSRAYIGENPEECGYVLDEQLYSTECGGAYTKVSHHVPASNTTPTFTRTVTNESNFVVRSVVELKNAIGYIVQSSLETNRLAFYTATKNEKGELTNQYTGLIGEMTSQSPAIFAHSYSDGFVTYDDSYSQFYFFESTASLDKPTIVSIEKPKNFFPLSASTNTTTGVAVLYADNQNSELVKNTTVGIKSGEMNISIKVSNETIAVEWCSDSYLCILGSDSVMSVWSISQDKTKEVFQISDVIEMQHSALGKFYFTTHDAVMHLIPDEKKVNVVYDFGDYVSGGLFASHNLMIYINNTSGETSALLFDEKFSSNDIDKKVGLLKSSKIGLFSAYKNTLFVAQDLGEPEYIVNEGYFGYPQDKIDQRKSEIDELLNEVEFDKLNYQIFYNY